MPARIDPYVCAALGLFLTVWAREDVNIVWAAWWPVEYEIVHIWYNHSHYWFSLWVGLVVFDALCAFRLWRVESFVASSSHSPNTSVLRISAMKPMNHGIMRHPARP